MEGCHLESIKFQLYYLKNSLSCNIKSGSHGGSGFHLGQEVNKDLTFCFLCFLCFKKRAVD